MAQCSVGGTLERFQPHLLAHAYAHVYEYEHEYEYVHLLVLVHLLERAGLE